MKVPRGLAKKENSNGMKFSSVETFFLDEAHARLRETAWYKSCPDPEKIELKIVGVENRTYNSIMSGDTSIPVLVILAIHPVESHEIVFKLNEI